MKFLLNKRNVGFNIRGNDIKLKFKLLLREKNVIFCNIFCIRYERNVGFNGLLLLGVGMVWLKTKTA
jgi:hypothetical protein